MNIIKRVHRLLFPKPTVYKPQWEWLKEEGARVGEDVGIWDCKIDMMCPELITIGSHTTITCSRILVHDSTIKRELGYRKIGKVTIGDYVFVSAHCLILPGTYIPNKVIVGARCTIKGTLEENSLYIANEHGMPVKVGTYDDYMAKHRERILNGLYVFETPIQEMTPEERAAFVRSLPEGVNAYVRPSPND